MVLLGFSLFGLKYCCYYPLLGGLMSKTASSMLDLNTPLYDFRLSDIDGTIVSSSNFKQKALLIMFICNHCPYVLHVLPELLSISHDFKSSGLDIVAINSNDVIKYPDDHPKKMKILMEKLGRPFPYLWDESQAVAKKYLAACTPDFYLYNEKRFLVYRGRLDESTPGNGVPVTGVDLRAAISATLEGSTVSNKQFPSVGCNIKWK